MQERLPREEYIKKKEQEKLEVLKKLEHGVKNVFTSGKYKTFLETYSKFHNYSINNTILILVQKPEVSRVASFQTWKKLGRNINKGEKGIKVLVPIPYKYEKEIDKNDEKEVIKLTGTSFRVGNVFDICQTTGKDLPKLTADLTENSHEIEQAIDAVAKTARVPIHFDTDMPYEKKGYYHIEDKKIVINDNLSDTQTFKTLIHEIAHSKLHAKDLDKYSASEREVQAESVAFVVCNKYGIDTSEYSFGYIAGWSQDKEVAQLKSSLNVISKCSNEIIKSIDKSIGVKSLEEIAKRKTIERER